MPIRIDYHQLLATTSPSDIDALVAFVRADDSPSKGIVVPPVFARHAVDAVRGSGIRVASVAGYPLGLAKPTIKAIEATSLAKDGVDAVEVTPLLANLLAGDWDALRDELLEIVRGVRAAKPTTTIHVRLDLGLLVDLEFAKLADAIVRGACDGVVLDGGMPQQAVAGLAALETTSLERKLIPCPHAHPNGPGIAAIGRHFASRSTCPA